MWPFWVKVAPSCGAKGVYPPGYMGPLNIFPDPTFVCLFVCSPENVNFFSWMNSQENIQCSADNYLGIHCPCMLK